MTRNLCITERIGPEQTGLRSSLYTHVEFDRAGNAVEFALSEKGKDAGTLDKMFDAIGASFTSIIKQGRQS